MATKKSAKKPPAEAKPTVQAEPGAGPVYRDVASVLSACAGAAGLAMVKEGFAWDPEHDRLFALGFPHLRLVAEGLPEDADPAKSAAEMLAEYDPYYRYEWPREVACRWLRAMGTWFMTVSTSKLTKNGEEAIRTGGPITAEEAKKLVAFALKKDGPARGSWKIEDFILLLEAMVGAEVVVSAMVETLESLTLVQWTKPTEKAASTPDMVETVFPLGFLLLRLPEPAASAYRARLEALLAKREQDAPRHSLTRILDVVLHGAEGAERSSARLAGGVRNFRLYAHATDNPALVKQAVADFNQRYTYLVPDARLVFLGGPPVLDLWANTWSELKSGAQQSLFLKTVGEVRADETVSIALAMASASKAKKDASAWLAAHAAEARPILERIARAGGDEAPPAAAALERLAKG